MKKLAIPGAVLLALIASVSCGKIETEPKTGHQYIFEGKALEGKITIGDRSGDYYPCLWAEGDELYAYKISGGGSVGVASLVSKSEERYGTFSLYSEEVPGTQVRLIYPSGASYSKGSLPSVQGNTGDFCNLSNLTHAYSSALNLTEDGTIGFSLTHAMAVNRIEVSCKDLPASATVTGISLRSSGANLSGNYRVNYDEGTVTADGSASNEVSLDFSSGEPSLGSETSAFWLVSFPSGEVTSYHLVISFTCEGKNYSVDFVYKARLRPNTVNVFNARNFSITQAVKTTRIHIIGDSTAATQSNTSITSYRGWGQLFQYYFNPALVQVNNCARGGASTKTFRSEGYWTSAKAEMNEGDYLLIQFGHNDENVTDERGTTPEEYYNNLLGYIEEARAIGVRPVLLTPILRRRFLNNIVQDDVGDNWTHVKYSPKVLSLADSLCIPLIDALEHTRTWLNGMGDEASKNCFVWFAPGAYPAHPEGKQDNTHLNQKGAFEVAGMIARSLCLQVDSLTGRYRVPSYNEVKTDLGDIRLYYEDSSFGDAGQFEGNVIGREYDKPEKGKRPDTLGFEVYKYAPQVQTSSRYKVTVEGFDAKVIPTTYFVEGDYAPPLDSQPAQSDDPQVCVFGTSRTVAVKVKFLGGAPSTVCIRPKAKNYSYTLSGDELTINLKAYDRISVEADGDLLHPLFIFVNPNEVDEYFAAIDDPDTRVLEPGKVYSGTLDVAGYKKLFIRGGALVKGTFTNQYASNGATISGCGIIDARTVKSIPFDLHYASNATISNLTIINKLYWNFRLVGCENVTVDNVKSVGACPFNDHWDENDAFHFVACRNVSVKRCFGYSWDDAFVLNSSYVYTTTVRFTQETYSHHFEDCIAWNVRPGNSFEIGWSNLSDIHDITYKNCYAIHSGTKGSGNRRSGFSIHNAQKAVVSDIHYEDIYVEDPQECGLTIAIIKGSTYEQYPWQAGKIRNVTYKNVSIGSAPKWGLTIQGYDSSHQIEGVEFDGLTISGSKVTSISDSKVVSSKYPAQYYNNITFK